jgi:hypothetical protein
MSKLAHAGASSTARPAPPARTPGAPPRPCPRLRCTGTVPRIAARSGGAPRRSRRPRPGARASGARRSPKSPALEASAHDDDEPRRRSSRSPAAPRRRWWPSSRSRTARRRSRDRLQRVLEPGEPAHRLGHGRAAPPRAMPLAAASTSAQQMAPHQPHGRQRHQRMPAPSHAAATSTPRSTARPRDRAVQREQQRARGRARRERQRRRVVGVEHRPVRRLIREDARLGRGVGLERRVPVEVVGDRFSSTAIHGWNVSVVSSWKLLASTT